jgi:pimeloyl-ACP methyl ester carboxylesterase
LRHVYLSSCALALLVCLSPSAGTAQPPPCGRCAPLGILFIVNGSNADYTVSENIDLIVAHDKLPLQVETVRWCRCANMCRDHLDYDAQIAGAQNLTAMILGYRRQCPHGNIYVMGHSAGCHVALVAAGNLPPDTLDRVVLLAPSVSNEYDLRPALRACRRGILHFYSKEDQVVQIGAEMLRTADLRYTKMAGETGFIPLPPTVPDAKLYWKLRQYYWHPDLHRAGHCGGHYGHTKVGFLDACVLPLMFR